MTRFSRTICIAVIALFACSCRSRYVQNELSLAAKDYRPKDGETAYLFTKKGKDVVLNICLGSEWQAANCKEREFVMPYVVLRKFLVDELKLVSRDTALKQKSHATQYERLQKKGSRLTENDRIRMTFHLAERDYYRNKKEQTRSELEQLIQLEDDLTRGMVFVLSPSMPESFAQAPLAEKLRAIFYREKFNYADASGMVWRFLSNDAIFYGAERLCQKYFPGYRLPTSSEAAVAVGNGLARSSFRFVAKQHYPQHTGVRTFWTSDLPSDDQINEQFSSVPYMQSRAWAQNFEDSEIKGQLLMMNFRSTLFCVKQGQD